MNITINKDDSQTPYAYLSKDPVMKNLIAIHGEIAIDKKDRDIFSSIVSDIIGQQLSGKAADTIEGRFKKLLQHIDPYMPTEIVLLEDDTVRYSAGLSYAKIKYIKGLSLSVINKEINLEKLIELSDEEVLAELTKIKGIGPWTAEMLLMFTYKRPDVFSLGDAGLRKAISLLYGIDKTNTAAILALADTWRPYRTYASRYLWKSLDNQK